MSRNQCVPGVKGSLKNRKNRRKSMGSSSHQIDPKPFKKVELALFFLYLKVLEGKMQNNPSICTLFKSRWSRNACSKSSTSHQLKNHNSPRFDLVQHSIFDICCYLSVEKVFCYLVHSLFHRIETVSFYPCCRVPQLLHPTKNKHSQQVILTGLPRGNFF